MAFVVCQNDVHQQYDRRHASPTGVYDHKLPKFPGRSATGWHSFANVHSDGLQPEAGVDWWHVVRRRNQEKWLHIDELPLAAKGRHEYALFSKRGSGR